MVAFKSADPLLRAALGHEREGRQVEAKAAYREYLSQHPDGIDAPAVRRRLSQLP
jgi:TolA-binding protein